MTHPAAAEDLARRRFRRFAIATVVTIYALILVGGIVRATGAGMGCPDWPTCFGQWIPPTAESQLPADYQTIYADRGYANTTFNLTKTWTEYLNRLLGVFTGFAILLTLLAAWPLRQRRDNSAHSGRKAADSVAGNQENSNSIFLLSLAAFVLVVFQGWLGSRVVASNLSPGMITVHMLVAQVIVGLVIAAVVSASRPRIDVAQVRALPSFISIGLIIAMVLGLLQLVIGTQVREAVDLIARASDHENRHLWIDNLPWVFTVHKWYALPLVALNAWLAWQLLARGHSGVLRSLNIALVALLLGTSLIGMSMDRLHLPMFAQPLHLWFASLIFGVQLAITLVLRSARSGASAEPRRQVPMGVGSATQA